MLQYAERIESEFLSFHWKKRIGREKKKDRTWKIKAKILYVAVTLLKVSVVYRLRYWTRSERLRFKILLVIYVHVIQFSQVSFLAQIQVLLILINLGKSSSCPSSSFPTPSTQFNPILKCKTSRHWERTLTASSGWPRAEMYNFSRRLRLNLSPLPKHHLEVTMEEVSICCSQSPQLAQNQL